MSKDIKRGSEDDLDRWGSHVDHYLTKL
jgi:hypothetical protein